MLIGWFTAHFEITFNIKHLNFPSRMPLLTSALEERIADIKMG